MNVSEWPLFHYATEETLYVHDGDTPRVLLSYGDNVYSKRYLRLIGVYAPELKDPGGIEGRDELIRLISPLDTPLYIQSKRDAYSFNRLLAWIYYEMNGELISVNDHMIAWLSSRGTRMGEEREARLV